MASSLFTLRAWQSSRTTYLQVLLALDPQLHTSCISSPNHHHLFAAHAHTNAACFAAIPMLCYLPLVSLSAPYFGVYLLINATHPPDHSHLCSLKCHHLVSWLSVVRGNWTRVLLFCCILGCLLFQIIPTKAFARNYGITGIRLSVCLFVCLFVSYHDN